MPKAKTKVRCPTCDKELIWDDSSAWRPFCSERCRLIDLGDWLDEKHRIPEQPSDENGQPFTPSDQNEH